MRLDELVSALEPLDLGSAENGHVAARDQIRAVQAAMTEAIKEEAFLLDCLELEIERLGASDAAHTLPFREIVDRGISLRMFYWEPGGVAAPHEHTSWTVTGVVHGSLEVTIYDWNVARDERRLEARRSFTVSAGEGGHIHAPCIHSPRNATAARTATLHVYNSSDGPRLASSGGPIPGLVDDDGPARPSDPHALRAEIERERAIALRTHVEILATMRSPRAFGLLEIVARIGDLNTRRLALRAIATMKREHEPPPEHALADREPELESVAAFERRFARTRAVALGHLEVDTWHALVSDYLSLCRRARSAFSVYLAGSDLPQWIIELADLEERAWSTERADDPMRDQETGPDGPGPLRLASTAQLGCYEHDLIGWADRAEDAPAGSPTEVPQSVLFWRDRGLEARFADIGPTEARILRCIEAAEPVVASQLGVSPDDLSEMVDDMLAAGILLGEWHPASSSRE